MKIVRLSTYHAAPRWLFLKIETDEGIVGWGEPVIEGRAADRAKPRCRNCREYLIGQDPSRINDLWQTLYRGGFYRGGPILMSAIAGIDQALWDIKGKALGVPVYELLGGRVRDRMKTYRWVGGDRPARHHRADASATRRWASTPSSSTAPRNSSMIDSRAQQSMRRWRRSREIREAFGNTIGFGIDFHGRVSVPMAQGAAARTGAAAPAVRRGAGAARAVPNTTRARRMRPRSRWPPGERMYSRFDFKRVLQAAAWRSCSRTCRMPAASPNASRSRRWPRPTTSRFAPHCPLGPVALAACLQVDFVAYNAVLQEQSIGIHYNQRRRPARLRGQQARLPIASTATSPRCPARAWAWRSTRSG